MKYTKIKTNQTKAKQSKKLNPFKRLWMSDVLPPTLVHSIHANAQTSQIHVFLLVKPVFCDHPVFLLGAFSSTIFVTLKFKEVYFFFCLYSQKQGCWEWIGWSEKGAAVNLPEDSEIRGPWLFPDFQHQPTLRGQERENKTHKGYWLLLCRSLDSQDGVTCWTRGIVFLLLAQVD